MIKDYITRLMNMPRVKRLKAVESMYQRGHNDPTYLKATADQREFFETKDPPSGLTFREEK